MNFAAFSLRDIQMSMQIFAVAAGAGASDLGDIRRLLQARMDAIIGERQISARDKYRDKIAIAARTPCPECGSRKTVPYESDGGTVFECRKCWFSSFEDLK